MGESPRALEPQALAYAELAAMHEQTSVALNKFKMSGVFGAIGDGDAFKRSMGFGSSLVDAVRMSGAFSALGDAASIRKSMGIDDERLAEGRRRTRGGQKATSLAEAEIEADYQEVGHR